MASNLCGLEVAVVAVKTLCEHVRIETTEVKGKLLVGAASGVIMGYFSWSRKYMADVPRVRCIMCKKSMIVIGYLVRPHGTPF